MTTTETPAATTATRPGAGGAFVALSRAQWYGFIRDKQTLFWVIAFPLMFLILFGGIFTSNTGESRSSILEYGPVPVIDQLSGPAKAQFDDLFKVTRSDNLQHAITQVRDGKYAAVIEQNGTTLVVHYSQSDQVRAATVRGTLQAFLSQANQIATGQPPKYQLQTQQVEDKSLTSIQYITPGLLGWAVAMGASFGAALTLVTWRNSKLLRRLRLSPMGTGTLVASRTLISIVIALVQTAIFIVLAKVFFGLQLTGAWWMAIPLVLCGTLAFMAIGLFAGSISKTAEGASGIANLIVLPMAFLSGSFIPLDAAPSWIKTVAKLLPLGYLNEGMLDVMVRGKGPSAALLPMAILLGFALVIGFIGTRFFRWEKG